MNPVAFQTVALLLTPNGYTVVQVQQTPAVCSKCRGDSLPERQRGLGVPHAGQLRPDRQQVTARCRETRDMRVNVFIAVPLFPGGKSPDRNSGLLQAPAHRRCNLGSARGVAVNAQGLCDQRD